MKLGGPDIGSNADWVASFARQAPLELGDVVIACTGHYYAMGPPDDPSATIDRLLRTDPRIDAGMSRILPAARDSKLAFRMTEGNSCYRGGKPGVSNAFASALWGGDYMLHLARLGCAGINFHGGSARQIRAALGDHLPGAASTKDAEAARHGTWYTPIAGSPETGHFAQPVYYGMLMATQFAGSTLFSCEIEASGANASAYAASTRAGFRLALFNKDAPGLADQDSLGTRDLTGSYLAALLGGAGRHRRRHVRGHRNPCRRGLASSGGRDAETGAEPLPPEVTARQRGAGLTIGMRPFMSAKALRTNIGSYPPSTRSSVRVAASILPAAKPRGLPWRAARRNHRGGKRHRRQQRRQRREGDRVGGANPE